MKEKNPRVRGSGANQKQEIVILVLGNFHQIIKPKFDADNFGRYWINPSKSELPGQKGGGLTAGTEDFGEPISPIGIGDSVLSSV